MSVPPLQAFEPLDLRKVFEAVAAEDKELDALVVLEGDCILLTAGGPYEIELDRCRDYRDILGWVLHLWGKDWVTQSMLKRFVRVALKVNGLAYPAL